jgi:hypothetical protein
MAIPLQSGTQGDTIPITLVQADGITPWVPSGYTTLVVVVTGPLNTAVSYAPTSVVSNLLTLTTVVGMFPVGGTYKIEAVISYASGVVTKTTIATIPITQALI